MNYKRLEIYVGWTCNQKCTYCMEFPTMEKAWKQKVTKQDILKKLLFFKKLWYNHVTYLWWEPFIQGVFWDALKLARYFWYTTLVTTNATTLHIETQAQKFLPYIDELFLSVEALKVEDQQKISRTKNFVHWEEVFENIKKYWSGKMLKANIVVTQDNLAILWEMVEYLHKKWVQNIAITYPDIDLWYYGKSHILEKVAPSYTQAFSYVLPIVEFCEKNQIHLKLADFPFCIFPENIREKIIPLTDDYDYQKRVKVTYDNKILTREEKNIDEKPRVRLHQIACQTCKYKHICWGPSGHYEELYGMSEIQTIL